MTLFIVHYYLMSLVMYVVVKQYSLGGAKFGDVKLPSAWVLGCGWALFILSVPFLIINKHYFYRIECEIDLNPVSKPKVVFEYSTEEFGVRETVFFNCDVHTRETIPARETMISRLM